MDNSVSTLISLLLIIIISLGVFLLLRSIMLWYWKVDIIVKNQEIQNKLLKNQNELLEKLFILQGGQLAEKQADSKDDIRAGRYVINTPTTSDQK